MQRAGPPNQEDMEPTPSTSSKTPGDHENMTLDELYAALAEYLLLESKFQPRLCLPNDSANGEVTTGARDGAAHVLRCLKVWFDLPTDILIDAVNLFDRFLTKMKVRPCHVPCITVSCMNIAIDLHHYQHNTTRTVSIEELVAISQSACTAGDVSRMSAVISDKLGVQQAAAILSVARWVQLLRRMILAAAAHLHLSIDIQESELLSLLEIVVCDAECATARPSELATVLIYYKLEQQMLSWSSGGASVPDAAYALFDFGGQLQLLCRMCDASLVSTGSRVRAVIARYEARRGSAATNRQRLVWRLSSRTLKVLRPTERLTSLLPTIQEQHLTPAATSPANNRNRSGSESSESEDTADWPRSPVLPVYCDN